MGMRNIMLLILTIFFINLTQAQNKANVFLTFSEFKEGMPSKYCDFQLKQRTTGNVFMTGGITNYQLKKINPSSEIEKMTKIVWGVKVEDSLYINSYPYSKIAGYNKILEKGFYSFFIGEPARFQEEQIKVGIIKEGESHKGVCCKTSYVILTDGSVKWLNPELLKTLISDNKELIKELETKNFKPDDVYELFDFLTRYNQTKK